MKNIVIKQCLDCPHINSLSMVLPWGTEKIFFCIKEEVIIYDEKDIYDGCELPDAK